LAYATPAALFSIPIFHPYANAFHFNLDLTTVRTKLEPVAETVRLVKKDLPEGTALIGFAGAPWTVACYMLQGRSGKEFEAARLFALTHPARMQLLMDTLVAATFDYLCMQISWPDAT
jgi:uroporphyrinogen decarboxylase